MAKTNWLSKQILFIALILGYLKIDIILSSIFLFISIILYLTDNDTLQISIKGIAYTAVTYSLYLLYGGILIKINTTRAALQFLVIYLIGYVSVEIIQEYKQYYFFKEHSQKFKKYCYPKYSSVIKIFKQASIPNVDLCVVESTYINAFCLNLFLLNKKFVVITSELSKKTINYIELTLMHETGHLKHKHRQKQFLLNLIMNINTAVITKVTLIIINIKDISPDSVLSAGVIYSIAVLIQRMIMHKINRKNEYEADRFVLKNLTNAQNYIKLLKSINHFDTNTSDALNVLFSDTPSISTRIKQIEVWLHSYIRHKQVL